MAGSCCVTTLTTAGRALVDAWTMAESSVSVSPPLRLTSCGLVRDWSLSTVRVTPVATSAVRMRPAAKATIGRMRLSLGLGGRVDRVPGQDQLAVWLEPGVAVELDRGLVVRAGPDVA